MLDNGILKDDTLLSTGITPPLYHFIDERTSEAIPVSEMKDWLSCIFRDLKPMDPFSPVAENLAVSKENFLHIVSSDVPILKRVASHLFETHGKRLRPAIVLLVSKALNRDITSRQQRLSEITEVIDFFIVQLHGF